MTGRNIFIGTAIAVPALFAVDGLLGAMAWYASRKWAIGLAVFLFMFVVSGFELALVAYVARRKQEEERRRAAEYFREA
jgi:hypothetical protein